MKMKKRLQVYDGKVVEPDIIEQMDVRISLIKGSEEMITELLNLLTKEGE